MIVVRLGCSLQIIKPIGGHYCYFNFAHFLKENKVKIISMNTDDNDSGNTNNYHDSESYFGSM